MKEIPKEMRKCGMRMDNSNLNQILMKIIKRGTKMDNSNLKKILN